MNAASCDFEQKKIAAFITYAEMPKKPIDIFLIKEYFIIKIWIQNQISEITYHKR